MALRQCVTVVCYKMRRLLFIINTFMLVACARQNSRDRMATKEFNYSAFLWHLTPESDSFNFYLAHYIKIDKNGHFQVMRRDTFMAAPHFFEGLLPDTLCKLIDKTFATDTFKTDYNWNVNDGFTYDGFKYYIDIKKLDSINAKKIFFIPNKAPSELNRLAKDLDTLIYN